MITNLERYKNDLASLISLGDQLHLAMQLACFPEAFAKALSKQAAPASEAPPSKPRRGKAQAASTSDTTHSPAEIAKVLPNFNTEYQTWYSEAKALVRQVLPHRLDDFVSHYEKPKPRKEITCESYRIEDYLQGLTVTSGLGDKVVGPDAAVPHFRQQLAIVAAVKARFESSLFDIRQLVQADLLDSEVDAAKELARNGFLRAAGAVVGVVLEKHLSQLAENHGVKLAKKAPTIADFNDALKTGGVIDVPQWRFIQHLGDIRNLCDHNKTVEPTKPQVVDLIDGVTKITKTLF